MSLSLLLGSDLRDDRLRRASLVAASPQQHLEAVVRGCVFALALLIPFAVTSAPAAFDVVHHVTSTSGFSVSR